MDPLLLPKAPSFVIIADPDFANPPKEISSSFLQEKIRIKTRYQQLH
ncbi:MAG: hypothetical protein IPI52_05960 [Bacteroidetes bacterium]|nr:hypothetical protein [Bacteroidota bacterium]